MSGGALAVRSILWLLPLCVTAACGATEWKAPAEAAAIKNPVAGDEKAAARGASVYKAECAACHGPAGKGDGEASATLRRRPPDLTTQAVGSQSDGELFWKITYGRRPMPRFGRLPEKDRWSVVTYLRTLVARRDAPKQSGREPEGAPDR